MNLEEQRGPDQELGFELPKPAALGRTRAIAILIGLLVVAAAAFVIGYLPKRQARDELAAGVRTDEHAARRVEVVTPKPLTSDHAMLLPGTIQALEETVIYPRADGYCRRWLVDIGDKVAAGALLAEIDTPEVDKEIAQARAQLAQAKAAVLQNQANRQLSKANLDRYQKLAQDKLVSASDLDQRKAQAAADEANVAAAESSVAAAQANVSRLEQLAAYSKVTAPFAGKVTQRTVERGSLVTGTTALFRLQATDPVRVFIQVPQDVAPTVKSGLEANVTVNEFPDKPFPGKVARAAGALDPTLRTMNTEVRVPNPKDELLPGMYAQVALSLPSPHKLYEIPATALYNDASGLRVAVVDASGKIAFAPVTIERDTGAAIQIATGLTGGEKVVKLSDASLAAGTPVDVVAPEAAPPAEKKK
jgi:membrane fusion protein, multidrug efflux system